MVVHSFCRLDGCDTLVLVEWDIGVRVSSLGCKKHFSWASQQRWGHNVGKHFCPGGGPSSREDKVSELGFIPWGAHFLCSCCMPGTVPDADERWLRYFSCLQGPFPPRKGRHIIKIYYNACAYNSAQIGLCTDFWRSSFHRVGIPAWTQMGEEGRGLKRECFFG